VKAPSLTDEEHAAVAAAYDELSEPLRRYAEGLPTRSGLPSGRDLANQTWKRAVEKWHTVGSLDRDRQMGWLRKVCRELQIDELRRLQCHGNLLPQLVRDEMTASDEVEHVVLCRLALDACVAALRSMPDRQREVARLAWLLQMPRRDIARLLEMNQVTIRVHLHNARKVLEREAGPHLPFPLSSERPRPSRRDTGHAVTDDLGEGGA
jgi:RNA polymerase sigma factor (sigma-70 family)